MPPRKIRVPDKPVKGLFYGGEMKALPVDSVRVRVGAFAETKPVSSTDSCTVFAATLKKGHINQQAGLLDKLGKATTSAYYVYVRKI
ncbi:hypothetical protein [Pontiella sulfatireligans]|nr:hypothetical protein [Pontiella sulfatireligans]